jgi:hypothetical protein
MIGQFFDAGPRTQTHSMTHRQRAAAYELVLPLVRLRGDPRSMFRRDAHQHSTPNNKRRAGLTLDDLHDYLLPAPRRSGRPPKHDLSAWIVTDDWLVRVPVAEREVDVFEAWFGDILDELLRSAPEA